jgi:hypothetical protein
MICDIARPEFLLRIQVDKRSIIEDILRDLTDTGQVIMRLLLWRIA